MKKMFVLLIAIGFAIGAEAQNYVVRNALKVNTRVRIKSWSGYCTGIGCEATANPGIGQICPPGSTIVPSCNGSVAFYNGGVEIWNGFVFTAAPVVGNVCTYPMSTSVIVPGVGTVFVQWLTGPSPILWIHL